MSEDLTKNLPSSDGEKLTQILSTVQRLDSRLSSLEQKVEGLEEKLEERLFDTRPIWEKVDSDIVQLQAGQERLEDGLHRLQEGQQSLQTSQQGLQEVQESLRGESREVRTALRDIFRRLSIFNDTLVTMQADYREIYDRIREMERQR
jgi:DNA repair ATPase RecN